MKVVNIIGIDELNSEDATKVLQISEKNFEKMQKKLHNLTAMNIKINSHNQKGSNKKFSIISSVNLGNRKFEASSQDWKVLKALKASLIGLSSEIEHSFHISNKSRVVKRR